MKKTVFLLILFGCFFASNCLSQQLNKYNLFHPSFGIFLARPDISVDTVYSHNQIEKSEDLEGNPIVPFPRLTHYFTRSDDLLTDTMHIGPNSGVVVFRYNEKNQLIYGRNYYGRVPFGLPGYMQSDYEYDEKGRLVRTETNSTEPSGKITFIGESKWDYSTIKPTEKGFIFNGIECELDDQGRYTLIKYFAREDSIVEFFDGKKYRVNDMYYSYTDSSLTEFGCRYRGNGTLARRGDPVEWIKSTDVYNENGDVISNTMYVIRDGDVNWRLTSNYITEYRSKMKTYGGGDVSNDNIRKTNTAVYARPGAIQIYSENAVTVQIFDLTGRAVKQQALSKGESKMGITSGFYFVKVGNESFKVYVK